MCRQRPLLLLVAVILILQLCTSCRQANDTTYTPVQDIPPTFVNTPNLAPSPTQLPNELAKDYLAKTNEYLQQMEKAKAVQTLEEGIRKLGGSSALGSFELLNKWWDTTLWNAEGGVQRLSETDAKQLCGIAELLCDVDCYLFSNELSAENMFTIFTYFADRYIYLSAEANYSVRRDVMDGYHILVAENNNLDYAENPIIFPPDTVKVMLSDLFGYWRDSLPHEYYAARWNANSFHEYMNEITMEYESNNWGADKYPEFDAMEDGAYFYDPGEPRAPAYALQEYAYLGEDTFYVILNGDGIDGEDFVPKNDFVHLIVKRTDTPFGFTIIAKPQDLHPNREKTLICEGWKLPENMVWVGDEAQWHS
jgi:hypothetical protein